MSCSDEEWEEIELSKEKHPENVNPSFVENERFPSLMILWRTHTSLLEMMHIYAASVILAKEIESLKAVNLFVCGRHSDDTAKQVRGSLEAKYSQLLQNFGPSKARRQNVSWITLCDSLKVTSEVHLDSVLTQSIRSILRCAFERASATSKISVKKSTFDYIPSFLMDFLTICLITFIPIRLCFSLNSKGEIAHECAWESHKLHFEHEASVDVNHRCEYSLWCEAYCLESDNWIPVLPSIYEDPDGTRRSVHYTWGFPYAVAIGSQNAFSYKEPNEASLRHRNISNKETLQLSHGQLRFYVEDVTIKYTSEYLQTLQQRKLALYGDDSENSDESDEEVTTSFDRRSKSEKFLRRSSRKYGRVVSVEETFMTILSSVNSKYRSPTDCYVGESRERNLFQLIWKQSCPIPTSAQVLRNHPVYILRMHLRCDEAIRIPRFTSAMDSSDLIILSDTESSMLEWPEISQIKSGAIAGLFKNSIVFNRSVVYKLRTDEEWLAIKQLVPKRGERPLRYVHTRGRKNLQVLSAKYTDRNIHNGKDNDSGSCRKLYGRWQLEPYQISLQHATLQQNPPRILPRDNHGNFSLLLPNSIYRLYRSIETRSQADKDKLFYNFISGVRNFIDEHILDRIMCGKYSRIDWWSTVIKNFPHENVKKILAFKKDLEVHFPLLLPQRGLVYLPYTQCTMVLDAENQERKMAAKKILSKRNRAKKPCFRKRPNNLGRIDYIPVVINFDRINHKLYLPRKQGVIIKEADFHENDYPNIHKKWTAFWYLREEFLKRKCVLQKWQSYFEFLASRDEVHMNYGTKS